MRLGVMATIKHILFPFDFSQQGVLAAPFVRAAAQRLQAQVTLLGVVPPVWDVPVAGMPAVMVDTAAMERGMELRLEKALTKELEGLDIQRETRAGDPALQITEFADENRADLIMMPTHGCGLFRSLLIGSVTSKVLHDAKCPVWTATHAEEQRSPATPRVILCAVDGTAKTPALMQWAAGYARQMGSSLRLLHVVPRISDWLALQEERELQEQVRDEARAKLEAHTLSAGVDAPVRIAVGSVSTTVTEEARQEGADLVIIGRGTLQAPFGRLRTHAYGIVQAAPCPVLSV
jgi:nucleotide-binding universal stress UspA family protein